jgi:hypothetical protein
VVNGQASRSYARVCIAGRIAAMVGVGKRFGVRQERAIAVLRVLFGADPDPKELERQGMPPLLARLMLAEARFWRWVWSRLKER